MFISILLLFVALLFSHPTTVFAICNAPNQYYMCGTGTNLCPGNHLCCTSPAECPPTLSCFNGTTGIETALGCLPMSTGLDTIEALLFWSVSLSGALAVVLIIYAAYTMITSSGDPKKVQAAQEVATAVIGGVIFIALVLVIVNWIGASLLNLGPIGFIVNP